MLAITSGRFKKNHRILMKVTLMKLNYCSAMLVVLLPVLLASCGGGRDPKERAGTADRC